ncbi:MAG: hypothetical protein RLZZ385_283 [Pseudomonadota bacterium]|jgi:hypothetical protein
MRLPDFTEFHPFNELRRRMGAAELGYFELFDPNVHLTGHERSELERVGLLLTLAKLRVLPDRTLAIKNSRVLLYIPDDGWYRQHREYPAYHVAWCARLESFARETPEREYLVTSRIADEYDLVKLKPSGEVSLSSHGFVVCKHCLHSLRYRDYDEFRNRRRGYSQKVLAEFRLQDFFRLYQQYPLGFNASRASRKVSGEMVSSATKTAAP